MRTKTMFHGYEKLVIRLWKSFGKIIKVFYMNPV